MKIGRNNPCPCGSGKKYKKCCLNKEKSTFFIGDDTFYSKIEPLYKNLEFEINTYLEFEISLPFQIALEDKSLFSFKKENCILHYMYKLQKRNETVVEHNLSVEKYYTSVIIGISYNSCNYNGDISSEETTNLFDYSLEELNKQIIAYTVCTKDDSCFRINKETLFPIVITNLVNLEEKISNQSVFTLHRNFCYKKDNISYNKINDFIRHYNIYNEQTNPMLYAETYRLKANRKFKEGFYDEAVISVQTNIEILINIIYKEILLCSNYTEIEIQNTLENKSFMSIIKKELFKYLGGKWDITRSGTHIQEWYDDTYMIRNKILHAGYYPTFEETDLAINAAMKFRDFIFDRIRANKTKYARLNEYFTN